MRLGVIVIKSLTASSPELNVIVALRHATAAAHEAIEQLPMMQRLMSTEVTRWDYYHYLVVMRDLYTQLETIFYTEAGVDLCQKLGLRPKVPALLQDMREQEEFFSAAGLELPAPPSKKSSVEVALHFPDVNALVGGFYVLEGATLGGRTIARHLRKILGDELGGARLLDFHGEHTATVWKQFAAGLDELCAQQILAPEAVIQSALRVFAYLEQYLERCE
jgi:heme oxygenase (biliverdin-IX-beta and delta-forming)